MSLISIADLELYLQKTIQNTDDEDKYTFLISSVQDLADSITYRTLEETTYSAELHDGDGTNELYLDNYPIRSVDTVLYGWSWSGSTRTEITSGDYLVDNDIGRLSFGFNSIEGNQVFSVDYTAGYTADNPSGSGTVPDDLKQILLDQIETSFKTQFISGNLKSDKLGDGKKEYFSSSDLGDVSNFAMKLSKYVRSDI